MIIVKRCILFMSDTIDRVVLLICLFMMLIGVYALYDSFMVFDLATDDSILKYKPGYESDNSEITKEIQGTMAAWITVDGTGIDYPIMQGKDNIEYLNKDPFGDYALSGSIFLDARNSVDFSDHYSLIYGHHMEKGMMFGALDAFLSKKFFNKHTEGTLIINGVEHTLRIFAVVEAEATVKELFAPTEHDKEALPYIKKHALYINEKNILREGESLVGLSTCKYPDTQDRTIVYAALERNAEK